MSKELHLYPSLFKVEGKPLEAKWLPEGGPWYAGPRLKLSPEHEGFVIFDAAQQVHLVVVHTKSHQPTQSVLVATREKLEGAYEKTTNSWLRETPGGWELVTSTLLLDFEMEQNISGQTSSVSVFKKGKFELQSMQLPEKREFPLKK